MKIAIISDTHLGHKFGEERGEDSFDTLKEAIEIARGADAILLPGDIFDSRIPRPEVMAKAMKLIFQAKMNKSDAKIMSVLSKNGKEKKVHELNRDSVPVIAIYGTHERRGKDMINPVELLDEIGFLVCLHGDCVVIEKNGEKVAVCGLSGVPEAFAKKALEVVEGRSVRGAYNIMMMHQSIEQYMYSDEFVSALRFEELPQGYDLIVNGHIHCYNEKDDMGIHLLIPGSTITTQVRKKEAAKPKGIVMLDTKSGKTEFVELKSARKVFYEEVKVEQENIGNVREDIVDKLSKIVIEEFSKKPIVKIRLIGKIDRFDNNFNFYDIEKKFSDRIILTIENRIVSRKQEESFMHIKKMRDNVVSINERGFMILAERSKKAGIRINFDKIFDALAEDNVELAEKLLKITEAGGKT